MSGNLDRENTEIYSFPAFHGVVLELEADVSE
jgi:hypothetical protein